MVILAVDVRSDGSADGDEFCSRRYRQEPSSRQEVLNDFGEAHTAFAFENTSGAVEVKKPVQQDLPDHTGILV